MVGRASREVGLEIETLLDDRVAFFITQLMPGTHMYT
jgi:hypothetical protein